MKKRRLTSLTLSLLASASALTVPLPGGTGGGAWPAQAAGRTQTVTQTVPGLDAKDVQLANVGKWNQLVERLQSQCEGQQSASQTHAWLAFALMFLDKQSDLSSLAQKVAAMPASEREPDAAQLVSAFNLIAQKKYADAGNILSSMKNSEHDVLANLALAAVSAKTGDAAKAVDYCERAVSLAPNFAWGYRTIGFLQDRTLKNPDAAEAAFQKALAVAPDFKEVRDLLVDLRVAHNDFDGAIDAAEAGIKANPRDAANYYRLSQVLTQQWRLREADVQLDKAIRLAPDNPRYHRAKASILRYEKRMNEAIAEQQRAVDLSSDKAFELTELAALNELAGNDSAAADNLKQALSLAPVSQAAYQSAHQKLVQLLTRGKRFDDLIAEYNRALTTQPDNSTFHLGLAEALAQTGKTDEAMKQLKAAADLDSRDPRPHRMLGSLLLQKKDYAGAARAYTRALNINPSSVDDLVSLGYTYALNDDYMQAETAFVTALALQQLTQSQGNRAAVMRSFATLLLTEGRYTEATQNYEEVARELKNSPSEKQDSFLLAQARALKDRTAAEIQAMTAAFEALPEAERNLARGAYVDSLIKLGKYDNALEQMAKAPSDMQPTAQWLTLKSKAYRHKGDLAKSAEYAEKAVAARDDNNDNMAEAYTQQGLVLLEKGDLNKAEAALHRATDLNNKSFAAYEALGRVFFKHQDTDKALEATKRALEINPYDASAYLLNGDVYLSAGKNDQSLTNYKRAIELYPASLDAHRRLRDAYRKLAQKDEMQKEDQTITQLEQQG